MLMIVGTRTDAHSLRSQVRIGSESDYLFGQFDRIFWISDSEAGVKVEKTGGVAEGEGRCGEVGVGLLASDRRSLDILSVKKEAKLSASETHGAEEGKGEEELKTWTQSEIAPGKSSSGGKSLRRCIYNVLAQEMANHRAKFGWPAVTDVAAVTKPRRENR